MTVGHVLDDKLLKHSAYYTTMNTQPMLLQTFRLCSSIACCLKLSSFSSDVW